MSLYLGSCSAMTLTNSVARCCTPTMIDGVDDNKLFIHSQANKQCVKYSGLIVIECSNIFELYFRNRGRGVKYC